MIVSRLLLSSLLAPCLGALFGCSGDDTAELRLTTWGEDYVEEGIPEEKFADGFSVEFQRFLLVLGDFHAVMDGDTIAVDETHLVDLTKPGPHELGVHSALPAGRWAEVDYRVRPLDDSTVLHTTATEADVSLMAEGPYSVYVEGEATRGDERFEFAWAFDSATTYANCHEEDGGPGFTLPRGATTTVELTIHADHLFYDDLADEDAELRFEPLAEADADGDGIITLEELAQVALVDLPAGTYGTGSVSGVNDLRGFVGALVAMMGHFNGEGHCHPR